MNETIKDLADFAKMTSPVLRESGDSTLKAIAYALDLSQVEIKRLSAINAELELGLKRIVAMCFAPPDFRNKTIQEVAEQALKKAKQ